MTKLTAKLTRIADRAVQKAQEENRKNGIPYAVGNAEKRSVLNIRFSVFSLQNHPVFGNSEDFFHHKTRRCRKKFAVFTVKSFCFTPSVFWQTQNTVFQKVFKIVHITKIYMNQTKHLRSLQYRIICYNINSPIYFSTICCIFKYYLKEGHKYG